VVFVQGKTENTTDDIIQNLPKLVHFVGKSVDTNFENQRYQDMKHFEIYKNNVQALRQINNSIKRYLDIDVTVSSEDIREIATGYRALQ
jgi:predicted DNA binding CopG/RHH family protein